MSPITLILIAIGLGLAGWLAGRAKAWSFQKADPKTRPVARPIYHAWYVAIWIAIPVLAFIAFWSFAAPQLITQSVLASPAAADLPTFGFERDAWLSEARAVASGRAPGVFNDGAEALIEPFREAMGFYNWIGLALTFIIAFGGGVYAFLRIRPDFRARTKVERTVMVVLLLASLIAILTTFGIFASLTYETFLFFNKVSPIDFLFGTFWGPDPMSNPDNPDGAKYGAIPLFWGTIFIGAIIAMIVAIPLGLMSAIYLTQYADPKLRTWVKPALEILAGVPTV
ncbi:MAG: phosphate ABC transporter permease family protein, partial [Pseudomonadota bacterium]